MRTGTNIDGELNVWWRRTVIYNLLWTSANQRLEVGYEFNVWKGELAISKVGILWDFLHEDCRGVDMCIRKWRSGCKRVTINRDDLNFMYEQNGCMRIVLFLVKFYLRHFPRPYFWPSSTLKTRNESSISFSWKPWLWARPNNLPNWSAIVSTSLFVYWGEKFLFQ